MVEFGVVVVPEPPEPVAPFGDQDVVPGGFRCRAGMRIGPARTRVAAGLGRR